MQFELTLWGIQTVTGGSPGRRTVSTPGPPGVAWSSSYSGAEVLFKYLSQVNAKTSVLDICSTGSNVMVLVPS